MEQNIVIILDDEQRRKIKEEGIDVLLKRSIKELAVFYVEIFHKEPTNLDLIAFGILLNEVYKSGTSILDEGGGLGFIQIKKPEGVGNIHDSMQDQNS